MWKVRYADSVITKDIPKLSHTVKQRIQKMIETKLMVDPIRFGKPLRYSLQAFRSLRVGDYRILYILDDKTQTVSVTSIGHRKDVYDQ